MATLIKILDKTKLQDKIVFAAPANEGLSLTTGLQAFYKLDDETDSSGNGNTLTNNGNVSFAAGKIGNAAVFDGTNRLHNDLFLGFDTSKPFCVSFWANPTTNSLGTTIGSSSFNIHNDESGALHFNNAQAGDCSIENAFTQSVWKHYVCIVSAENTIVYMNGSQVYNEQSAVSYDSVPSSISVGAYDDNNLPFNGSIDAVGIWNRALSEAEIAALYNSGAGLELP